MTKTAKRKVAKRPQPTAAAVPSTPPPPPISTTLSLPASELVRWYCGVTHHREADTIEGAVYGVLTRAKDAYEGTPGMDEAFNWIMEDVLTGMNDDARHPLSLRYGGGVTVQLSIEASELLHRALESDEDPRDVISGCVESMLGCALDDADLSYNEAIQAAKEWRLAREQEGRQMHAALQSYHERKQTAAVAAATVGKEVAA